MDSATSCSSHAGFNACRAIVDESSTEVAHLDHCIPNPNSPIKTVNHALGFIHSSSPSCGAPIMIERIRITVLTITCICIFTDQKQAWSGITVENNIVTKATLSDGITNINVQFVFDSFDNITSGQTIIEIMPWFSNQTKTLALADNLSSDMNDYETANSVSLSANTYYLFVLQEQSNGTQVRTNGVFHHTSSWVDVATFDVPRDTSNYTSTPMYFAILDTGGNSSVPEPSTAIAMGLLGIVGFAGNRRRRRQESVA